MARTHQNAQLRSIRITAPKERPHSAHRHRSVTTMKCPFCSEELSVQRSAVLDENYLCAGLPDNWLSLNPKRFDCRSHNRSQQHPADCFMFLSTATYYYNMGSWLLLKPRRVPKHKGILIGNIVIQN